MKNDSTVLKNEETLDATNWKEMRKLGKQMVDDAIDYLESVSKRPAFKAIPDKTKKTFTEKLPQKGQNLEEIYSEFLEHIFPYSTGNIHPRFWSWVQGSGTLSSAFADFLASIMNPNVTIGEQSAMYVDAQIVNWAKEMMGFAPEASGILLSGGSMANITGLIVARNSYGNLNAKQNGLKKLSAQMIIYCSDQTHNSIQKAAEAIGIGSDNVRKIESDENFQMKIENLEHEIKRDKNKNLIPLCVVGNCGTVNSGAIDDLNKISEICKKENIWFHIDGAFGALAKLTDEFSDSLKAIEKADSLAFDFHKWMHINYEVGCLLVRDAKKHRDAFTVPASYLVVHEKGLSSGPEPINNYGMELSRGFKALKIWMALKENGILKYKRLIEQNIAQARYLESIIKNENDLELISPARLNIVCYRFNPKNLSNEQLNDLNKKLLMELHEQGIAAPSYTILKGSYVIRVCITNHRTKKLDLEILVKETLRIGKEILKNE